ncbi:MAG: hypothetical protein NTY12_01770 [Candidatus Falkowbacteria bacterium]|nr:hypothetical protein [Candidatus Falkowbacteria bacterium]
MKKDFTTMEIMEYLKDFSDRMDQRFYEVDEFFNKINQRFDYQDERINMIETSIVTKNQFNSLVGVLQRNKVISEFEAAHAKYEGFGSMN